MFVYDISCPSKDVWCTYGVRYKRAPYFFNRGSYFTSGHLNTAVRQVIGEISMLLLCFNYLLRIT